MKPPYAIGSVPSLSGHAIAYRWRSLPRVRGHRASKPQGSSERVLPWQITMDQLIFASLSHTHWYEVGMLKVAKHWDRHEIHSAVSLFIAAFLIPSLYPALRNTHLSRCRRLTTIITAPSPSLQRPSFCGHKKNTQTSM